MIADIPEAQINQNDDHLKQAEIVLCVVRSEKNLSHYTNVCAPNQKTITVVTEEQNKTPSVIYGPLDQEATIVSIKEKIKTLSLVASPKKIQTPKKTPIKKTIIKKDKFNVNKLGVKFVLVGSTPNLLAETLDLSNSEARYEFFRRMSLLGVNRGLIKTGARPGDIVLVGGKDGSREF